MGKANAGLTAFSSNDRMLDQYMSSNGVVTFSKTKFSCSVEYHFKELSILAAQTIPASDINEAAVAVKLIKRMFRQSDANKNYSAFSNQS